MVILRKEQNDDGSRSLSAELNNNGDLVIEGLDYGKGVMRILGCNEYEWVWTIKAKDVVMFSQIMGIEADVLQILTDHFKAEKAADLHAFMSENQIPFESWSRTGD